jgi:hypothetical protein
MSNIINFPESESFSYSQYEGGVLAICGDFSDIDIDIERITEELFSIQIGDQYVAGTRKQVSEFLWAAAYMLDSDQEWVADKYPSINK